METLLDVLLRAPLLHFLNFLRGMETHDKVCKHTVENFFLNFLRGMETKAILETHRLRRRLPKLP